MNDYFQFNFTISPFNSDAADLLAAFLADIGFESFEQTEDGLAAYIQTSISSDEDVDAAIMDFPIPVSISWKKHLIRHHNWNEEWEKKYFRPLVIAGGRCVVHSTFHKDYPESEYEIVVDPKMAFGTGHHATTTMMVNHLFNLDLKEKRVIDMGTGTGILAIIASKLGAKDVTGIEIDAGAYENAIENAQLNHADINLKLGDASLLADFHDVDVFLANINRNILVNDMERYAATLRPGSVIIVSGFYEKDIPCLESSFNKNGIIISSVTREGEGWVSIKGTKTP